MQSTIKKVKNLCKELYDECFTEIVKSRITNTDILDKITLMDKLIEGLLFNLYREIFYIENHLSGFIKSEKGITILPIDGEICVEPYGIYCSYYENLKTFLICLTDTTNYKKVGIQLKNNIFSHYGIKNDELVEIKYLNLHFFNKKDYEIFCDFKELEEKNNFLFLEDIILALYGDNKKSFDINKLIETKILDIRNLTKCKISELAKIDIYKFNSILFEQILLTQTESINLEEEEKEIIKYNILNTEHSNEILKLIYTFVYTKSLFENDEKYDYYDLTFITVSVFKLVEVLFFDYLNEKFPQKIINDKKGRKINLGKENLTLGEMFQIFECDDEEICNFLQKKDKYSKQIVELFSKWLKSSRNGYLHKHIISVDNIEQLNKSIDDSIKLICLLVLLFD